MEIIKIRVIPQLTFTKNKINLIAEESWGGVKKGDVVLRVNRDTVYNMVKPLQVMITKTKVVPIIKKST